MIKLLVNANVRPRTLLIAAAVINVAHELDLGEDLVITFGRDGGHRPGSKHYDDRALDVRSKTFPDQASKDQFLAAVIARLGQGAHGILEDPGGPNEHFHISV